jgi:hypothetical protein
LLFACLAKRRQPEHEIVVIEQNPRAATFGFGVVFSAGALSFLERDEPEIYRALAAQMESWPAQKIVHRDEAVLIDGNGFSAIARLKLLELLQERAERQGVQMTFGARSSLDTFAGFDRSSVPMGSTRWSAGCMPRASMRASTISPTSSPGTARDGRSIASRSPFAPTSTARSSHITIATARR